MQRIKTIAVLAISMTMSLSAVAAPPDALVNNNLSLPGEITKSIMLDTDVSEIRGEVWPVILGVVAVDLALQAYFYGVYVPSTRRG
ncbi:MAG: hypothetical protein L7U64_00720 [Luminiphilus sp.]|jgi:hypothetical protein|uniref:Uncharacterized protein n=1 Tax=Candidatus Paraluminiphilus aquimaris TaxID=2518994 RepID=A0ABY6QAG8_9GAMM|nr:hypothetical protein [Candidatus Paraluminiphilus aquimaris]MCH1458697.1 hypothetical protein [Luminiphilus sp.]UZP75213.1 hypothetical protein E0F26_10910 [Candidatus Paraluminiphilus aquimaris]